MSRASAAFASGHVFLSTGKPAVGTRCGCWSPTSLLVVPLSEDLRSGVEAGASDDELVRECPEPPTTINETLPNHRASLRTTQLPGPRFRAKPRPSVGQAATIGAAYPTSERATRGRSVHLVKRLAFVEKSLAVGGTVGWSPGMAQALHPDEIPVDVDLVRALVGRAMPDYADAPVRRLPSSGSTNSLFRLGDEFLVRLPRQPGGSASISKEAAWLPVLGPGLPVSVPDVVAVFEPDRDYPERWSVVRWIEGEHPWVVDRGTSVDARREGLAKDLAAVLEALQQAKVPTGAG